MYLLSTNRRTGLSAAPARKSKVCSALTISGGALKHDELPHRQQRRHTKRYRITRPADLVVSQVTPGANQSGSFLLRVPARYANSSGNGNTTVELGLAPTSLSVCR